MSAGSSSGRRIDAHLVGASLERRDGIVAAADPAADGQRDEDLARDRADGVAEGPPPFNRRRDVQHDDLVRAFVVIASRE